MDCGERVGESGCWGTGRALSERPVDATFPQPETEPEVESFKRRTFREAFTQPEPEVLPQPECS